MVLRQSEGVALMRSGHVRVKDGNPRWQGLRSRLVVRGACITTDASSPKADIHANSNSRIPHG